MKRPTIKDVARESGYSLSTVSLVVNQRGYVSPEARTQIMQVVERLGYHPTRSARGLASRTSGNIGFILTEDHFSQAEPFYTRIFLGTEFEARTLNYYILLTTVPRQFSRAVTPRFLLERNVDGVIVAGKVDQRLIEHIETFGIPIVLVDYELRRAKHNAVLIDNYGGGLAAVRHLVEGGHRAIAFVGADIEHPSIAARFDAYRDALREANIEIRNDLVVVDGEEPHVNIGASAAERLLALSHRPTAIFAANDALALGCLQQLRRARVRVPEEMALVGFDDIESCVHTDPPLSTVRVPKEEMGKLAVQRLVNVIAAHDTVKVTTHVPVQLVVRRSSSVQSALLEEEVISTRTE